MSEVNEIIIENLKLNSQEKTQKYTNILKQKIPHIIINDSNKKIINLRMFECRGKVE